MTERKLWKGNHALGEGAIHAGCRFFFGYPITPQNELLEYMALRLPEVGGSFVQAESEVAAINMVLGAAVAGGRVLTASSGPGLDLYQEGIGNLVAHRLPCVIADIARGGPGNGAIHPSQGDYAQAARGARADVHNITLAPWTVQEMFDLATLAFDLADTYRHPVVVLADAVLGQLMEEAVIDSEVSPVQQPPKPWALTGAAGRLRNLSIAHFPEFAVYNGFHSDLQETYRQVAARETRYETYFLDRDTRVVVVAYGIAARASIAAVRRLHENGEKVALVRPITVFPFPYDFLEDLAEGLPDRKFLVAEMSAGQMAIDVMIACGRKRVYVRPGCATAEVPKPQAIVAWVEELLGTAGAGGLV